MNKFAARDRFITIKNKYIPMKTYNFLLLIILFASIIFTGCGSSVETEDLYGEWKYIKVENPNQGGSGVTPDAEIKENDPSISFSSKGELEMIWGGKQLSHGTFELAYPLIVYQENLPGGKSRTIKFLIKKLENDVLVFETREADVVRVTAEKVKAK